MSQPAIEIKNVSKKYTISHKESYYTLRDTLSNLFSKSQKKEKEEFWALKDINLEVKEGEILGVIGKNGAGKSTLLKILTQITPPTTGKIAIEGRVSSLLEVGTGFHPELTGRENIYLNGAILGMSQKEIKRKFNEIVAFSEIEQFLDTPVKRYSSGMYVRLAFAVAAHLEPEILLVDEVLAVGDAQFQKKCLGKMGEVAKGGRTIIFVSHNMAAIAELCSRCILLEEGKIISFGSTQKVINKYLSKMTDTKNGEIDLTDPKLRKNSLENSLFKWTKIRIVNSKNKETPSIEFAEPFEIIISGKAEKPINDINVGFGVTSVLGFPLFNSHITDTKLSRNFSQGEITFKIRFDPNLLGPGTYDIDVGAVGDGVVDWIPEAIRINVEQISSQDNKGIRANYDGIIVHPCKWSILSEEV